MEKISNILHLFSEIFTVGEWQYVSLLWEFEGTEIRGLSISDVVHFSNGSDK